MRGDDSYSSAAEEHVLAGRTASSEGRLRRAQRACRLVNTVGATSREDAVYRAGTAARCHDAMAGGRYAVL
jgi:hypothetical protein